MRLRPEGRFHCKSSLMQEERAARCVLEFGILDLAQFAFQDTDVFMLKILWSPLVAVVSPCRLSRFRDFRCKYLSLQGVRLKRLRSLALGSFGFEL